VDMLGFSVGQRVFEDQVARFEGIEGKENPQVKADLNRAMNERHEHYFSPLTINFEFLFEIGNC
jgi:hypothetical protein